VVKVAEVRNQKAGREYRRMEWEGRAAGGMACRRGEGGGAQAAGGGRCGRGSVGSGSVQCAG